MMEYTLIIKIIGSIAALALTSYISYHEGFKDGIERATDVTIDVLTYLKKKYGNEDDKGTISTTIEKRRD